MGVRSELVAAEDREVGAIAAAALPSQALDAIDVGALLVTHLVSLHELLIGTAVREAESRYAPIVAVSDDGPWISRIPDELMQALAALDAPGARQLATDWALATEGPDGDVIPMLEAACALARRAVAGGRHLFLWVSL